MRRLQKRDKRTNELTKNYVSRNIKNTIKNPNYLQNIISDSIYPPKQKIQSLQELHTQNKYNITSNVYDKK